MTRTGKKLLTGTLLLALTLPVSALAADQDVNQKIDALQKELDALKKKTEQVEQKTDQVERKSLGRWLEIGGDYRFRYDYLNGSVANFYNPTFNASGQVNGFNFNPAFDVKNDSLYHKPLRLEPEGQSHQGCDGNRPPPHVQGRR